MCIPYKQLRKKGVSISAEEVNVSEREFLFGVREPLFLDMNQFCFLSEDPWETATFGFYFFILFYFSFLFNPHTRLSYQRDFFFAVSWIVKDFQQLWLVSRFSQSRWNYYCYLLGLVLWHINYCRSLMPSSF